MPRSKPTQRTLKELTDAGVTFQVVEHWESHSRRRIDLYGCIDVLALHNQSILGIQCCRGADTSTRLAKAMAEPRITEWLRCGGRFEVWGWRQLKVKRGGKAKKWVRRVVRLELDGPTLRSIEQ